MSWIIDDYKDALIPYLDGSIYSEQAKELSDELGTVTTIADLKKIIEKTLNQCVIEIDNYRKEIYKTKRISGAHQFTPLETFSPIADSLLSKGFNKDHPFINFLADRQKELSKLQTNYLHHLKEVVAYFKAFSKTPQPLEKAFLEVVKTFLSDPSYLLHKSAPGVLKEFSRKFKMLISESTSADEKKLFLQTIDSLLKDYTDKQGEKYSGAFFKESSNSSRDASALMKQFLTIRDDLNKRETNKKDWDNGMMFQMD